MTQHGIAQQQPLSPRTPPAFTLIELLVVVAIIALLIAILLPSLDSARRQAKQSVCLSNLKGIATSARVYESDDPNGWGIPTHPLQFWQDPNSPTYIGAYEWGGKSGIGWDDYAGPKHAINSKYGTKAGFGPATRPLNEILYKGGFKDHLKPTFNRPGAEADAKLDMGLLRCPADDGPPRAGHCAHWLEQTERSSFDHFGNSYAANLFMVSTGVPGAVMKTNSPYLRPITRVPNPARTLYFEENIGRWAWSARREVCPGTGVAPGIDPGPTKQMRGWHGRDWTYNRAFVDTHVERQRIYIEGTEDSQGYAQHYRKETMDAPVFWRDCDAGSGGIIADETSPGFCIVVRGDGWQKDTLPAEPLCTELLSQFTGRPSYENCVTAGSP